MNQSLAARSFDRRLYMTVAIAFPLIVLAGFSRTYYARIFFDVPRLSSFIVHVHGALMTMWVALFGTQVWLVSSRRIRVHQRLGYASIGLAVLIVLVGTVTAIRGAKYGSPSTPPGIDPLEFLVVPAFDLLMFVILFGGAVYYRKRPAAHKTLMLLTAVNFLPPAIGRIPIAPLQALGPIWFFGLPTLVALVCLGLDWRVRGKLNPVFATGTVLLIASYVARLALMGTAAWLDFAGWLTGFV